MHIFLDESGDLGLDFKNKSPSKFFVITLIQMEKTKSVKSVNKAIAKTLANKINHKNKKRLVLELKGCDTRLAVKKYFLSYLNRHVTDLKVYSIILDKRALLAQKPHPRKDTIYNKMTHQLLETMAFPKTSQVNLIVDRSKSSLGIKEFNDYLYTNLTLSLDLETKLYITHDDSIKHKGIQAADLFCYGIARKYEREDCNWYNEYKEKIIVECKFQI